MKNEYEDIWFGRNSLKNTSERQGKEAIAE